MTTSCRGCGAPDPELVIDLGHIPLVNDLWATPNDPARNERFPLRLALCRHCSLLQLMDTVDPQRLFGEYSYLSSYSTTMVEHARLLAERLSHQYGLEDGGHVIELASNDGYLLQHYQALGASVLGIEPARNIAAIARERGIPTRCEFFGLEAAQRLAAEGQRANVLHAHNVLAHVPDLRGFLAGMSRVLKPRGIAVVEVPHLLALVDNNQFDTIYHEHICYFSLTALSRIARRCGLRIHDVERVAIHGGSLRVFLSHPGAHPVADRVLTLLAEEERWGVHDPARYHAFASRIETTCAELRAFFDNRRAHNETVAAYGASAKGVVLLNLAGVDHRDVRYVADRSPHKQGRFLPGTNIPIVDPQRIQDDPADQLLVLVWNIFEEVAWQQQSFRDRGGQFVVPVPSLRVAA